MGLRSVTPRPGDVGVRLLDHRTTPSSIVPALVSSTVPALVASAAEQVHTDGRRACGSRASAATTPINRPNTAQAWSVKDALNFAEVSPPRYIAARLPGWGGPLEGSRWRCNPGCFLAAKSSGTVGMGSFRRMRPKLGLALRVGKLREQRAAAINKGAHTACVWPVSCRQTRSASNWSPDRVRLRSARSNPGDLEVRPSAREADRRDLPSVLRRIGAQQSPGRLPRRRRHGDPGR